MPITHHRCPLPGCHVDVPQHFLMCGMHWRMVPARLRSAVWDAYNAAHGHMTRDLSAAQLAAITAVREHLAERTRGPVITRADDA